MREMYTLHTNIERGAIAYNSPQSYDIISKKDGKIIDTVNLPRLKS